MLAKLQESSSSDIELNLNNEFTTRFLLKLKEKRIFPPKIPIWRKKQCGSFFCRDISGKRHKRRPVHTHLIVSTSRPKGVIRSAVQIAREQAGQQVIGVMRKVLYVVQNDLPISTSTSIHQLLNFFGDKASVNIISRSHYSNFSTYELMKAINRDAFCEQIRQICKDLCFMLHIDESTDISEENHMAVYITQWDLENRSDHFCAMEKKTKELITFVSTQRRCSQNQDKVAFSFEGQNA
uniref:Transposase n=1 Tax=Romanomermis culicivorax TaxID=13658 RepID=A0A915JAW4_ROMCU